MGREVKATLRFDGRILEGDAVLEADALVFRGPGTTITVKRGEIFKADASGGWLDLQTSRGLLLFELGPKAETWAERIKNPKGLVDKLGVSADKSVRILGKLDPDIVAEIEAAGAKIAKSARGKLFDLVFVAVSSAKDLAKVADHRAILDDHGSLWLVYPKEAEGLRERDVLLAGRTLGLTDQKPVKVSEALAAVRFVVPVAQRKKK